MRKQKHFFRGGGGELKKIRYREENKKSEGNNWISKIFIYVRLDNFQQDGAE